MQGTVVREDDIKAATECQASQPLHKPTRCAELSAGKAGFAEPPSSHLTADGTTGGFMPEPSSQAAAVEVFSLGKQEETP